MSGKQVKVADGFIYDSSLTLDQLKEAIKEEDGDYGLKELPERLERAHRNGHSALRERSLDDFLCCNRAGEDEKRLTVEECTAQFLS